MSEEQGERFHQSSMHQENGMKDCENDCGVLLDAAQGGDRFSTQDKKLKANLSVQVN